MVDLFNYFRRETTEVNIGAVPLGGPNSIRVQSMTNTSTPVSYTHLTLPTN